MDTPPFENKELLRRILLMLNTVERFRLSLVNRLFHSLSCENSTFSDLGLFLLCESDDSINIIRQDNYWPFIDWNSIPKSRKNDVKKAIGTFSYKCSHYYPGHKTLILPDIFNVKTVKIGSTPKSVHYHALFFAFSSTEVLILCPGEPADFDYLIYFPSPKLKVLEVCEIPITNFELPSIAVAPNLIALDLPHTQSFEMSSEIKILSVSFRKRNWTNVFTMQSGNFDVFVPTGEYTNVEILCLDAFDVDEMNEFSQNFVDACPNIHTLLIRTWTFEEKKLFRMPIVRKDVRVEVVQNSETFLKDLADQL